MEFTARTVITSYVDEALIEGGHGQYWSAGYLAPTELCRSRQSGLINAT
jgi:hypothetical protein